MSTAPALAQAIPPGATAYLVTVTAKGTPHVTPADPAVHGDTLTITGLGRRSAGNVARRHSVTVLWTPSDPHGHTLIVDGAATISGDTVTIQPTRAVLHRPAPDDGAAHAPGGTGGCAADCVELAAG